jgi:hypothetical protein
MIEKIYCLGTSHTRGGGFHEKDKVKSVYRHIVNEPSMDTLSWPGVFKTFLSEKIDVLNLAECGAGNERVYRLIFDIITQPNFNKEKTLFLIETSYLDRKEFWSNSINDFVICNYSAASPEKTHTFDVVKQYYTFPDDDKIPKRLYYNFLQETVNFDHLLNKLQFNLLMFFTFLTHFGINFKIIYHHNIFSPNQEKYNIFTALEYNINGNITPDWYGEASSKKYLIEDETNGIIRDGHQGYFINNIVAKTIYNKLVEEFYITGDELSIENTHDDFLNFKKRLDYTPKLI